MIRNWDEAPCLIRRVWKLLIKAPLNAGDWKINFWISIKLIKFPPILYPVPTYLYVERIRKYRMEILRLSTYSKGSKNSSGKELKSATPKNCSSGFKYLHKEIIMVCVAFWIPIHGNPGHSGGLWEVHIKRKPHKIHSRVLKTIFQLVLTTLITSEWWSSNHSKSYKVILSMYEYL